MKSRLRVDVQTQLQDDAGGACSPSLSSEKPKDGDSFISSHQWSTASHHLCIDAWFVHTPMCLPVSQRRCPVLPCTTVKPGTSLGEPGKKAMASTQIPKHNSSGGKKGLFLSVP